MTREVWLSISEAGWPLVFEALQTLREQDLERVVTVRDKPIPLCRQSVAKWRITVIIADKLCCSPSISSTHDGYP